MSEEVKPELTPREKSLANLRPAKPGEIRNPKGRPTAGASVKEWINIYAERDLLEEDLRKISRDPQKGWAERAAAERMVRSLEQPDMADFEPLLDGQMSLRELRAQGQDTATIKKVKSRKRTIPQKEGDPVEEVEREIELHDRAGEEMDRILDRTEGKPMQEIASKDGQPLVVQIVKIEFDG